MEDTRLTLYSYRTGEAITIDLNKIDKYILEDLIVERKKNEYVKPSNISRKIGR